jgi:hypothetical protein
MAKAKTDRNKKIVEMYDNPKGKYKQRYTFRSLSGIFQIAESTVREIYYREKARSQFYKNG